ncbi:asparaginyl/glutamyl-tRNA amidotransferase subunit C [candidate division WOR-1 bacterium RIFOXYA12_FULL_52_29]|uniref:Aspartyl/glutamyl-tRNA(Asn/Gln) amidotransferase subunit C n=1 Tax=candidate division WOR-1 bacterium RIFOXYC12_FULL_54_18 TaxID=1802584 RepID=A0A1F4T6G4_UNCSA|nr:MAG: asparaginyl/glutamyl-tRNA amidotransferase subunit C [candidate division WOR-1 bacterium RIFOXYA2_FULL_51_19]OGC17750.1 MAG: asparaginyl/glutamyl-tRNA amidotransferase subunit C [candidate division WOR-1 bacterium RIFOXYA12_FULL_52_29]OGC26607.1 MAG: asparaginyl/glutamyl-tRNA amidotransferase subunit C [candidate division WOR-1 bacterium RIFOXYB2_FULL_45_9]OGC28167.1 MAG: asparaginyl/glutamyl-tRNA amidotransferase subunit C [candidate division WOR-1 bacterium RIFOXYC12_FULL_54_18]OGC295
MRIDVEHVAKLARLGLTDEEKKLFGPQLSAILGYAENLNQLSTGNVLPTSHAIPIKNVLREDKVIPCANVDDIMANAPDEADHMFRVPRIVE